MIGATYAKAKSPERNRLWRGFKELGACSILVATATRILVRVLQISCSPSREVRFP
jgi:hypothetical protein